MDSSEVHSVSSRRRSLVQTASRKLSTLGQPKSRKEGHQNNEKKSTLKISPPFDFKDLSNASTSSSTTEVSSTSTVTSLRSKNIPPRPCVSPLDKPLPSLPVATIITGSPVKVRRSLIDAQEKTLRRSLSPEQRIFEEWPSLSPEKPRSARSSNNMSSPLKPSISEGLAERIKKLNLEDDNTRVQVAINKTDNTTTSPPPSSPAVARICLARPAHNPKAPLLPVRQNKASELRLRLSAGNMADQKAKKSPVPSPLSTSFENVTTRARPLKRSHDSDDDHRAAAARSRSRSRHRVTAEGSPYAIPAPARPRRKVVEDRHSSIVLDSSKVDTDFSNIPNYIATPDDEQAGVNQNSTGSIRKSSIPISRRLEFARKNELSDGIKSNELLSNGSIHAQEKATENMNKSNGHMIDTLSPSSSVRTSQISELDVNDEHHLPSSKSQIVTDTRFDQVSEGIVTKEANVTNNDSHQSEVPLHPDHEEFTSRPLSRNAPDRGPVLKVSPVADDYLRGLISKSSFSSMKNSNITGATTTTPQVSDHMDLSLPAYESSTESKKAIKDFHNPWLNNIDEGSDSELLVSAPRPVADLTPSSSSHSIPRKPVPDQHKPTKERSGQSNTINAAPPVKPGPPKDDSTTTAWPFTESAIAPFKTTDTPEHDDHRKGNLTRDIPKRNSARLRHPKTVTEESSPGKYDVKEALASIKPLARSDTVRSILANTNADSHEKAIAHNFSTTYPLRTTSKHISGSRSNGLRTPSSQAPMPVSSTTPALQASMPSKQTPTFRPHKMKSFTRSTNNLVLSTSTRDDADNILASPMPVKGAVSTGKGVLRNIKGLFHKRSNLHISMHGSLHRPNSTRKSPQSSTPVQPANQNLHSPDVQLPSSTGSHLMSRSTPKTFPTNRIIRPFASSSPMPDGNSLAQTASIQTEPAKNPAKSTVHFASRAPTIVPQQASIPATPQLQSPTQTHPELLSATALVHTLLDRAQSEQSKTKQDQLIELSKSLVETLTLARNVEKKLEEAKIIAGKCEIGCVKIRKEVCRVEELVRGILVDGDGERFELA